MELFCTGHGLYNSNKKNGGQYGTISWEEIYAMVANPPSCPKNEGQWVIFSSYIESDARSAKTQTKYGLFSALWVDIDHGDPTLATVVSECRRVLGSAYHIIHSTASSGSVRDDGTVASKWRVLIPLPEPLHGSRFGYYQAALNDLFRLVVDRSTEHPGRVCFLPNRGASYEHIICGEAFYDLEDIEAAAKALYETRPVNNGVYVPKQHGARSHVAAFNRKHSTEEMLLAAGFSTRDGEHWTHPNQSTRPTTFATQILSDGCWRTMSTTVQGMLGRKSGDAYDISVALAGAEQIEAYAKQLLADEDALINTDQMKANVSVMMAKTEEQKPYPYTVLPEPSGYLLKLTDWVQTQQYFPHRSTAILASLLIVSAVCGRKDENGSTGCGGGSYEVTAINGFGKEIFKHGLETLLNRYRSEAYKANDERTILMIDKLRIVGKSHGATELGQCMQETPSMLRIITESGTQAQSKAGDKETVEAAILSIQSANSRSRHSLTMARNSGGQPFGTAVTFLSESTSETVVKDVADVASGNVARTLQLRFDVSDLAVGSSRHTLSNHIPLDVIEGFKLLVDEAFRNDEPEEKMCVKPLDYEFYRQFELTDEAAEKLNVLQRRIEATRIKNIDNVPSIEWAHTVRHVAALKRLMLILARTEQVVTNGKLFITKDHYDYADSFIKACRKPIEEGNGDYSSAFDVLKASFVKLASVVCKTNTGTVMTALKKSVGEDKAKEYMEHGCLPRCLFVEDRVKEFVRMCAVYDKSTNRSSGRSKLLDEILVAAHDEGLLTYHRSGEKKFHTFQLTVVPVV